LYTIYNEAFEGHLKFSLNALFYCIANFGYLRCVSPLSIELFMIKFTLGLKAVCIMTATQCLLCAISNNFSSLFQNWTTYQVYKLL